ncbi:MAG: cupin [Actinomycetota bacterium]
MDADEAARAASGSVVLRCRDLDANVDVLVERLGFRRSLVSPADDPRRVIVERGRLTVDVRRSDRDVPVELVIGSTTTGSASDEITLPNGSTIVVEPSVETIDVPDSQPGLVVTPGGVGDFGTGRAGMSYRDLLPGRWGGRFISSHIHITDGGEVADWVHFHRIRFQLIHVASGWVDVVYEDQGEPFRMHAGDTVVQPPEIRHRVLRSSPRLDVIEVGCPAEHDTIADHVLPLPNDRVDPDRVFGGQRFVHPHRVDRRSFPWIIEGIEARSSGLGEATGALGDVTTLMVGPDAIGRRLTVDAASEFVQLVSTGTGSATITVTETGGRDRDVVLDRFAAVAMPPGSGWTWTHVDDGHEVVLVELPAGAVHSRRRVSSD